jgi:hypothetical protein
MQRTFLNITAVLEYFLYMIRNTGKTWSNGTSISDCGKLRLWFRTWKGYFQAYATPRKHERCPNSPRGFSPGDIVKNKFSLVSFGTPEAACSSCEIRVVPLQVVPVPSQRALTHNAFRQFWRRNPSWSWNTPLTQEIPLHMAFSCFLSWKDHILKPRRDSESYGISRNLQDELTGERRQLKTTLECAYSCRKELQRFRMKSNEVPTSSKVSSFDWDWVSAYNLAKVRNVHVTLRLIMRVRPCLFSILIYCKTKAEFFMCLTKHYAKKAYGGVDV